MIRSIYCQNLRNHLDNVSLAKQYSCWFSLISFSHNPPCNNYCCWYRKRPSSDTVCAVHVVKCECVPKNIMVPVSLFWSSHTYTYSRSAEAKFILLRCLVDIWSEQHLVWVELVFPEESSYICVSQPSILILIPSKSVFLTQPQDKFWSKWFTYFYSWVLWETKWHLGCKCLFYYNASSNLFWPSSNTATKAIFVVSLLGDPSIWI